MTGLSVWIAIRMRWGGRGSTCSRARPDLADRLRGGAVGYRRPPPPAARRPAPGSDDRVLGTPAGRRGAGAVPALCRSGLPRRHAEGAHRSGPDRSRSVRARDGAVHAGLPARRSRHAARAAEAPACDRGRGGGTAARGTHAPPVLALRRTRTGGGGGGGGRGGPPRRPPPGRRRPAVLRRRRPLRPPPAPPPG